MLTPEMNQRLTQVGPGTPCGNLLRRYWQPLLPSSELLEKPVRRVPIMGERLVVFRQGDGRYGCMAESCAHRGCSLYHGFVEDDGLRCPYHGWKYATDGACLEQPFEPRGSDYRQQIRQPAYPVEELAGLLFVYLGPEPRPLLPRWDVLVRADGSRKIEVEPALNCNWLQIQENTVDTVHTYYLHGHMLHVRGLRGGEYFYRPIVRYEWRLCDWGVEKVCVYGGEHPEEEVRPPMLFPNLLRIPQGPWEYLHWRVPIDDGQTRIIRVAFLPSEDGRPQPQPAHPPVECVDPLVGPDGEYDLTGFPGPEKVPWAFYVQDRMAWETQGATYDRSAEHLGASDRGIALFRKLLAEQIEAVAAGRDPIALVRDAAKNSMIEFAHSTPILSASGGGPAGTPGGEASP